MGTVFGGIWNSVIAPLLVDRLKKVDWARAWKKKRFVFPAIGMAVGLANLAIYYYERESAEKQQAEKQGSPKLPRLPEPRPPTSVATPKPKLSNEAQSRIVQHSEGPYSPNIAGNGNTITIAPVTINSGPKARRLVDDSRTLLGQARPDHWKVEIVRFSGASTESWRLADDLKEVFKDAQFRNIAANSGLHPRSGVEIRMREIDVALFDALESAFKPSEIRARALKEDVPAEHLQIWVWPEP